MSKSVKELIEGTAKLTLKRGEDQQDFYKRLVEVITEVSDKDWAALGTDAQNWFNNAVEAINNGEAVADYPDAKPAAPTRTTRAAKETAATPAEAQESIVGSEVKVTTARGKEITGTILEIDDESMVVKDADGVEHEFDRGRVKSVEMLGGSAGSDVEPKVGDKVTITTKRGVASEGNIVEMDEDVIVLDVDGKDVDFTRSRIASIAVAAGPGSAAEVDQVVEITDPQVGETVVATTKRGKDVKGVVLEIDGDILVLDVGGEEVEVDMTTTKSICASRKVASKVEEKKTGKRATKEEEKPAAKGGKVKASDNNGVSVTTRMFELICESPDANLVAIGNKLTAEKLTFNEATLGINYKLAHKVIELLKKNKHYK